MDSITHDVGKLQDHVRQTSRLACLYFVEYGVDHLNLSLYSVEARSGYVWEGQWDW